VPVRGLAYVHLMAELCVNIDRLDKSLRESIDFEPLVLTPFDRAVQTGILQVLANLELAMVEAMKGG
jgi:hypothetical protein